MKVKCDADKVIERYTQYENTRKTISELCSYLNYALVRDIKRLPQLAEEEIFCSNELSRQKRLLGEEEDKYNAEYGKLKQDEGGLKSFLEEVNRRRQHYESIGIGRIAERVGLKGELKVQQQSLIRQEEMVTSKNQSVKQKYDALLQESDTQLREYKLQAERRINEIEREQNESSSRLQMELNLKQAKQLDEMLRFFGSNKYEGDTDAADLLRQMNDLLWKFTRTPASAGGRAQGQRVPSGANSRE